MSLWVCSSIDMTLIKLTIRFIPILRLIHHYFSLIPLRCCSRNYRCSYLPQIERGATRSYNHSILPLMISPSFMTLSLLNPTLLPLYSHSSWNYHLLWKYLILSILCSWRCLFSHSIKSLSHSADFHPS